MRGVQGSIPAASNIAESLLAKVRACFCRGETREKRAGEFNPAMQAFAEMDEITFDALYNKTIDYGLEHIAKNHSREQVENWVAQILDFG